MAYNGWKNYETWNVKLWLDNEEGTQELQNAWAHDVQNNHRPISDLADIIKDFIEENNPLLGEASLYSDILSAALGDVDWYEIAEHILNDYEDED